MKASVQFIQGIEEEISKISIRKRRDSGVKVFVLTFDRVQAAERLRAYSNQIQGLWLRDEEGAIQATPHHVKFLFVGDDDLAKVECSFEVNSDQEFDRVMRFLNRYAEVHGFEFQAK